MNGAERLAWHEMAENLMLDVRYAIEAEAKALGRTGDAYWLECAAILAERRAIEQGRY